VDFSVIPTKVKKYVLKDAENVPKTLTTQSGISQLVIMETKSMIVLANNTLAISN
jgi:hypothetical protein